MKIFPRKSLDPAQLMLEIKAFNHCLARTEVESNKVINRILFEGLFREICTVKSIFLTVWSVGLRQRHQLWPQRIEVLANWKWSWHVYAQRWMITTLIILSWCPARLTLRTSWNSTNYWKPGCLPNPDVWIFNWRYAVLFSSLFYLCILI